MADQYRIRSHGSRWGPGKVHLRDGAETAACRPGQHIYAEPVDDTVPLTCIRCIKLNGGKT
jgi:hypothetical protein